MFGAGPGALLFFYLRFLFQTRSASLTSELKPDRFQLNRNGFWIPVLARFLHANRSPSRPKPLRLLACLLTWRAACSET